jgi:hypothetical protein
MEKTRERETQRERGRKSMFKREREWTSTGVEGERALHSRLSTPTHEPGTTRVAVPSLLTIALMPFSHSISNGVWCMHPPLQGYLTYKKTHSPGTVPWAYA